MPKALPYFYKILFQNFLRRTEAFKLAPIGMKSPQLGCWLPFEAFAGEDL